MKWRGRTWLQGPRVPRPGPVGQVDRWFETIVAFARLCVCGIETVIAFAGEKWAFLVCFSGAEVMAVSTSPCFCVPCAKFITLHRPLLQRCAKKFALLGLMWA